jgi:peptidyl-prolyl cis-trans isomerase A (cyclophilin A)
MRNLLLLAVCALTMSACAGTHAKSDSTANAGLVYVSMNTAAGEIVLELDHARAPISVDNFLAHAERGDYHGSIFHRVVPGFVVQGGGFTPDLKERAKLDEAAGHKDPTIKNEWTNGLKNARGTIAMARDAEPDTATREFYINLVDNTKLDGPSPTTGNAGYAVFGRVIKGMDIVDAIAKGETMNRPDIIVDGEGMKNVPVKPVVITSVRRIPAPVRKPAEFGGPAGREIPPPPSPGHLGQSGRQP